MAGNQEQQKEPRGPSSSQETSFSDGKSMEREKRAFVQALSTVTSSKSARRPASVHSDVLSLGSRNGGTRISNTQQRGQNGCQGVPSFATATTSSRYKAGEPVQKSSIAQQPLVHHCSSSASCTGTTRVPAGASRKETSTQSSHARLAAASRRLQQRRPSDSTFTTVTTPASALRGVTRLDERQRRRLVCDYQRQPWKAESRFSCGSSVSTYDGSQSVDYLRGHYPAGVLQPHDTMSARQLSSSTFSSPRQLLTPARVSAAHPVAIESLLSVETPMPIHIVPTSTTTAVTAPPSSKHQHAAPLSFTASPELLMTPSECKDPWTGVSHFSVCSQNLGAGCWPPQLRPPTFATAVTGEVVTEQIKTMKRPVELCVVRAVATVVREPSPCVCVATGTSPLLTINQEVSTEETSIIRQVVEPPSCPRSLRDCSVQTEQQELPQSSPLLSVKRRPSSPLLTVSTSPPLLPLLWRTSRSLRSASAKPMGHDAILASPASSESSPWQRIADVDLHDDNVLFFGSHSPRDTLDITRASSSASLRSSKLLAEQQQQRVCCFAQEAECQTSKPVLPEDAWIPPQQVCCVRVTHPAIEHYPRSRKFLTYSSPLCLYAATKPALAHLSMSQRHHLASVSPTLRRGFSLVPTVVVSQPPTQRKFLQFVKSIFRRVAHFSKNIKCWATSPSSRSSESI